MAPGLGPGVFCRYTDAGKPRALAEDSRSSTVPGVVRYAGSEFLWFPPHPAPLPVGEGTAVEPIANHPAGLILRRAANVSPSPTGRGAGVRGERSKLDRCESPVWESGAALGPNGRMALSHSLFRACGFAGAR